MEEIYLSADGLYEYSVAEINAAAARDKVTFEEFIASKGMKLKGGEVEETVEVEEKKECKWEDLTGEKCKYPKMEKEKVTSKIGKVSFTNFPNTLPTITNNPDSINKRNMEFGFIYLFN